MARHNSLKDSKLRSFFNQADVVTQCPEYISFNFKFVSRENGNGQDFSEWNEEGIKELCSKLRDFSGKTVLELKQDKSLVVYGDFPRNSALHLPISLPENGLNWGRLRLDGKKRVAGFFLVEPPEMAKNVFYLVFLDAEHEFYPVEKKHT
ncbi:MAG: hypothetical protein SO135_08780 [Sphaerochaetaceae bacterium]|nr:hypothetical protein [Sphaerochaetaceae bacterium]NLY07506.1 hypothetical protein [Spirochaetales bacterium]